MKPRFVIASVAALAVATILLMPLRTIIAGDGITARKVDGIIWDGSIRDLRLGKLSVGDVNARLLFAPLFMGRAEILLSRGNAQFVPGIAGSITCPQPYQWVRCSRRFRRRIYNLKAFPRALPQVGAWKLAGKSG